MFKASPSVLAILLQLMSSHTPLALAAFSTTRFGGLLVILIFHCNIDLISFFITGMSPTEVFAGTPYFAVFCLAMSSRIAWSALPNPYVRIITELLSSKFLSLMVSNINSVFSSEGAPSVRNKMTLFFFSPDSSEIERFRRLKAFSNPILY